MKFYCAIAIWIIGAVLGLYIGGWLMFIKPIMACCSAFDTGTLTATMVGATALNCLFGSLVGGTIFLVGHIVSVLMMSK